MDVPYMWSCRLFERKNKHALEHYNDTKHPIAIDLNSKQCWCFQCDEWVTEDNKRSELDLIRSLLSDVQSQEFSASYTRSGKLIRSKQEAWNFKIARGMGAFVSFAVSAKQTRRDKDFTAQFYYDRWLQVKCIEAWKIYTSNPKVNNDDDSIALESHTNTLLSVGVDDSRSSNRPSVIVLDDDALSVNPRATLSLKSPSPQSYRAKAQKETKEVEAAKFHKSKKKPKRKMSAKKKRVLLPGRVGLTNLGNTCYINSVFQALSHTKAFWKYFIKFRHENVDDETGITDSSSSSSSTENDSSISDNDDSNDATARSGQAQQVEATTSPKLHILPLRRQSSEECYEHANSKENKKKGTTVSLCYEIHSLLRVLWSGRWGVVTPNNLVLEFGALYHGFAVIDNKMLTNFLIASSTE